MKLLIDTNVILDVLLRRDGFYNDSNAVLYLCEEHTVEGFVTASSITDIFYITRKGLDTLEETYKVIGNTLNFVKVLTVTDDDVSKAFEQKSSDFEDCLMAMCALSNKCDAIVTRNKKDFESFGIALYLPTELLALFDR